MSPQVKPEGVEELLRALRGGTVVRIEVRHSDTRVDTVHIPAKALLRALTNPSRSSESSTKAGPR